MGVTKPTRCNGWASHGYPSDHHDPQSRPVPRPALGRTADGLRPRPVLRPPLWLLRLRRDCRPGPPRRTVPRRGRTRTRRPGHAAAGRNPVHRRRHADLPDAAATRPTVHGDHPLAADDRAGRRVLGRVDAGKFGRPPRPRSWPPTGSTGSASASSRSTRTCSGRSTAGMPPGRSRPAVAAARRYIPGLSFDLIFGTPGQTLGRVGRRPGRRPGVRARPRLDLRADLRERHSALERPRTRPAHAGRRGRRAGNVRGGHRPADRGRVRAVRDFQLRPAGQAVPAQRTVLGERRLLRRSAPVRPGTSAASAS